MASVFKALADPSRRAILTLLKDGPQSAGALADSFSFSKPTLSGHLTVLKEAGLVLAKRDGKKIIYHLQISVLEDALLGFAEQFGIEPRETSSVMGTKENPA